MQSTKNSEFESLNIVETIRAINQKAKEQKIKISTADEFHYTKEMRIVGEKKS